MEHELHSAVEKGTLDATVSGGSTIIQDVEAIAQEKETPEPEAEEKEGVGLLKTGNGEKDVSANLLDVLLEEKKQPISKPKKRSRKFYIWLSVLLLLSIIGSLLTVTGYQTYKAYTAEYHQYLAIAQVSVQHLQNAEKLLVALPHNPLDTQGVVQAQKEFGGAITSFEQLDKGLKSLPSMALNVPVYGVKLRAALEIIPLAIELSRVGIVGCNMLNLVISRFHDPLGSNGQGLTSADITTIKADFQQIETMFHQIVGQVNHLNPNDAQLDPRISKLLAAFHKYLPTATSAFADADKLLTVLPALLGVGTPANYLVEVLDSTELRPGGGFIGNYGIITLANGREADAHITDIDLLDRPFEAAGHVIPFPSAYNWFDLAPTWSLRDTNLDAEFPTVARYSEQNYRIEGGKTSFQGVIAITPAMIQSILQITGPITVPEYHETVTADNLISRIHYHQLAVSEGVDTIPAADGHSSQRKRFTALLAEHFMARIHQMGSSALSKFLPLALSSLRSKDLQVYLNSNIAESFLTRYHFDATIQAPPVGDSLFVVDANIAPSKANKYIINTMNDQVTIDAQGNAIHHTTLSYAWTLPGPIYGSSLYRDYVRVYVPPGSVLQKQQGWTPRGTSKAFGRTVLAGFFTLEFGHTAIITLTWKVPKAAISDANGWHYQYLLQRQAGTQWTVHLQVTLLACNNYYRLSGKPVFRNKTLTMPIQTLNGDVNESLDYTCSSS